MAALTRGAIPAVATPFRRTLSKMGADALKPLTRWTQHPVAGGGGYGKPYAIALLVWYSSGLPCGGPQLRTEMVSGVLHTTLAWLNEFRAAREAWIAELASRPRCGPKRRQSRARGAGAQKRQSPKPKPPTKDGPPTPAEPVAAEVAAARSQLLAARDSWLSGGEYRLPPGPKRFRRRDPRTGHFGANQDEKDARGMDGPR